MVKPFNKIPACRICDTGPEHQNIRAEKVYGGREVHKFWQCNKCDAVYLFPLFTVEEEERFYREEFAKFMSKRSGSERDWSNAEAHVRTNQDQVNRRWPLLEPHLRPGMDLLELGCSSGFMMNEFRMHGLNCIGIEPSGTFLEFLKKNGHRAYNNLQELQKTESVAFDLIVHFFLLEHISDPYSFLKETFSLLKPEGKIIAEIPCVNDPLTSLYNIPAFEEFYWSISHHYYYSPKSLAYVLDRLNFRYELMPEQRYDLSNHITWMTDGKPGGQGRFNHIFSEALRERYAEDMKKHWLCDTIFLTIFK